MSRHSMVTLVLGVVFAVAAIAAVTMTGMSVMELILVGGLAAALLGGYVVSQFQAGVDAAGAPGARSRNHRARPTRFSTWWTVAAVLILLGIVGSVAFSGALAPQQASQQAAATAAPVQDDTAVRTVNTATATMLPIIVVLVGATALLILGLNSMKASPSPAARSSKRKQQQPVKEAAPPAPATSRNLDWRQMLGLDDSDPDEDGKVAWWARQLSGDEDREP